MSSSLAGSCTEEGGMKSGIKKGGERMESGQFSPVLGSWRGRRKEEDSCQKEFRVEFSSRREKEKKKKGKKKRGRKHFPSDRIVDFQGQSLRFPSVVMVVSGSLSHL
ncbi:hypothetical protein CEXT_286491 [Caerostris extrusa]|uniref:Uncharacterized protein n=1 Tax=Caerostris extrusa TaxID=172846 RepID=A0AAV4VNQ5_CAEEX|nr:hypothetical protein CEXT_286491 [Caerostris extrusa]